MRPPARLLPLAPPAAWRYRPVVPRWSAGVWASAQDADLQGPCRQSAGTRAAHVDNQAERTAHLCRGGQQRAGGLVGYEQEAGNEERVPVRPAPALLVLALGACLLEILECGLPCLHQGGIGLGGELQ